ncbi:MAG: hypothetical protein ACRDU7_10830, partial [Acidimicrobiia bacterium]
WSTPTYSYLGNIFSFNPAKKFVSLLFHTGAQIPGDHPALEGDTETARVEGRSRRLIGAERPRA